MGTLATVGINDDLAARQTSVAVRSANHELARWVDQVAHIGIEQALHAAGQLLFNARNQVALDVSRDAFLHRLFVSEVVVLGRDHDRVNGLGHVAVAVANGHLALRIRAQVLHHLALFADGGKLAKQ